MNQVEIAEGILSGQLTRIPDTPFERYCNRLTHQYGDKFVRPQGSQLIDAYNNGSVYRVKVRTTYPSGDTRERWGYVSITTGWQPVFLLMTRVGQHGSSDVLNENDEIIDSRWGTKCHPYRRW